MLHENGKNISVPFVYSEYGDISRLTIFDQELGARIILGSHQKFPTVVFVFAISVTLWLSFSKLKNA